MLNKICKQAFEAYPVGYSIQRAVTNRYDSVISTTRAAGCISENSRSVLKLINSQSTYSAMSIIVVLLL